MMKINLIYILLFSCIFLGCSDYGKEPKKSLKMQQTISGLYMFKASDGKTDWILEAEKVNILENNTKAELFMPVMNFKENGRSVSQVQSKKGMFDLTAKIITLTETVKAKSLRENIFLNTEKLHYSIDRKKFYTNDYLKVRQNSVIVEGKGFKAASDLSEIEIYNQKTKIPKK